MTEFAFKKQKEEKQEPSGKTAVLELRHGCGPWRLPGRRRVSLLPQSLQEEVGMASGGLLRPQFS